MGFLSHEVSFPHLGNVLESWFLILYVGLCRFHFWNRLSLSSGRIKGLSLFERVMEQEDLHSLLVHLSNLSRVS